MRSNASSAWRSTTVAKLIEHHFSGPSPDCEERPVADLEEWGVLKTTAITWAGWDEKAHKVLPKAYWGKSQLEVRRGDVLVTKAGPRERVGVVVYVTTEPRNLIVSGKMIALRLKKDEILPEILSIALAQPEPQKFLNDRTTGMAESQVNFANEALLHAPVRIPPMPQQRALARLFATVDRDIDQTEALIAKYQHIKTGLMHDLLTRGIDEHGQLRDPSTHKFKMSPLGQIPEGWQIATLSSVCDFFSGGTPARNRIDWWNGSIPFLSAKDMKSFEVIDTSEHVTPEAASTGSRVMPARTIFILVRGMALAHSFPVCISTRPLAFNQDLKAIKGKSCLRTLRQNPRTEIKEPVIARSRRRRSNLARIENLKQRLLRSPRNDTLTVCQTGGVLSRSPKTTFPCALVQGQRETLLRTHFRSDSWDKKT